MKQNKKITNFLLLAALLGLLFPLGIQAQYSGGIGKGDARALFRGTANGPQIITQMVFTVNPPTVGPAQSFQTAVELRDASGNLVVFGNTSVSMAMASNPGAASLSGSNPVNAIDGLASFSLSIDAPGLGYTLQATSGALSTTSTAFNVLDIDFYQGGNGKGDARAAFSSYLFNGSWSPENPNGITTGETTLNTLVIESGAASLASATSARRVEIAPGASLEAASLSLTDSVWIQADANGYGQYKGSAQNMRMQQYVANAGWHNMSLPVSGNLSQFGLVNTAAAPLARNVYSWNEATGSWVDPVGAGDGSQVANSAGTGYMVYVGTNGVASAASAVEVRGAILTSATPSVSNAGTSNNANQDGWNLIANPFSCGLDFTQLSLTDVVNSFSIWDPATSQYKDYSGLVGDIASGVIAPMQAFWVKADGNSPSVGSMEMASDGTVGSSPTFYKSQNTIADRLFVATYQGSQPHKQDEVLIAMVAGTGDGLDPQWDAPSRINGGSMPTLMTVAQGDQLSHNAIDYSPNHLRSKALPLRFVSSQQGEIYFLALHDSLLTNAYQVELEDLKLRKRHDLTLQPYKFVHDANAEYRFVLHLTPVSTVSEGHSHAPISQGGFGYGINGGQLVLKLDRPVEEVEGRLLNLNGQQVMRLRYPAGVEEYAVGVDQLASGVYLLQWKSSQGEEVHKILLP